MKRKRSREDVVAKSEEALNSTVRTDGVGEDPVVKEILNGGLSKASDQEALDMALALRQIIRGQEQTLEQIAKQNAEIAQLKQEAAARDEAARKFNENQQKFLDDVRAAADSLRLKGAELDKLKANAARETQKAYQDALAKAKTDALEFEQALARMPKVQVMSGGVPLMTMQNGQPAIRIKPEIVRIKTKTWVLPPGKMVEVPMIVAEVLSERRAGQEKTEKLTNVMSQYPDIDKYQEAMNDLRKDEAPYDPNAVPPPA